MITETILPAGFEALEPFVESWAIEGTANRARMRLDSSHENRTAFFAAAKDLVGAALERLDQKPLLQFDDSEKRLMNLMLSLVHVSLAVEIQSDDEAQHAASARHITITRAAADSDS